MPIYCKEEGCAGWKKYAYFGPKGGKRQWCGTCAKTHGGVYLGQQKMCVGCKEKWASYGPKGGKRQ